MNIAGRKLGAGEPCFIIAEAGVNHNGELTLAKQLINAAVAASADAVKFQTFSAESLVTASAPKAGYQLQATSIDESQLEMLRRLELSQSAHKELWSYCQQRGIVFLSTPFDETAADFLDRLGVPAFKVGSGDLTNIPLLQYLSKLRKPIILSTGMADMNEVRAAVQAIQESGNPGLALLHCVSNYPANPADVNLRAMQTMATEFHLPVGYSDHTLGIEVALAAVALGACVIEKHLTLQRDLPGPDHRASLEPNEFAAMVEGVRKVEAALGDGRKISAASEADTARAARRSLTAARDIPAGTQLTRDMVAIQRPGTGLSPALLPSLLGRTAQVDIRAGSLLDFEMFGVGVNIE